MDFPPPEQSRFQVRAGDLLVCEGGEPGRAAIWNGQLPEIYYQKALHRVRPRSYSLVRWLFYCLKAATALNVFAVEGNTTTIAHLTGEQLRSHRFAFPDPATQERLVAFLDKAGEGENKLIEAIERQIGLLQEHRQALIAAVITGGPDAARLA
jgi:type I restriction enzyme S subunit